MIEIEFRRALTERVESHYLPQGGRIVHELAIPQRGARVDLAVLGDLLVGFEIKTGNDTLTRLGRQKLAYNKVFDRVYIAIEGRHLERTLAEAPIWWGVLELTETGLERKWKQHRDARVNPAVDLHAVAQLLWRQEVLKELEELGLAQGVRTAPRRVLWRRLADAAPSEISRRELHARLRRRLTGREDWRVATPQT